MALPKTMRATAIRTPGGPEVLEPVTLPVPEPRDGEILVAVAAAGVNRPDVLQRIGRYPVPPDADPLPGLEVAGTVAACGRGSKRFALGARVMALAHGGGYAEYCRVDERHCLPVPDALSLEHAAAIPETFFTVWYNVFIRAGLADGERLLVHGGSSGIGTTAIQLAKALGAGVVTTAGSDEKCRFCRELGADLAVNYKSGDWQAAIETVLGDCPIDVVLDMVAGDYVQKNLSLLRPDGRYVLIAFLGGSTAAVDLQPVLRNRLTLTGSTLRPRTPDEKAAIAASLEKNVLPLIESGKVRPVIDRTFALADARDAHTLMESSRHMGKLVLVTSNGTPP